MSDTVFPACASPSLIKGAWKPGPTRPEGQSAPLSFEQTLNAQEEKGRPDNSAVSGAASSAVASPTGIPGNLGTGSPAIPQAKTPGEAVTQPAGNGQQPGQDLPLAGSPISGKSPVRPGQAAPRGKGKGAPPTNQAAAAGTPNPAPQPLLTAVPIVPAVPGPAPSPVADGVTAQASPTAGSSSQAVTPGAVGGPALTNLTGQGAAVAAPLSGTPVSLPASTVTDDGSTTVVSAQPVKPGVVPQSNVETFLPAKASQTVGNQSSQPASPAGKPEPAAVGSTRVTPLQPVTSGSAAASTVEAYASSKAAQVGASQATPAAKSEPAAAAVVSTRVTSSPSITAGAASSSASTGTNKIAQPSQSSTPGAAAAFSNANSQAASPVNVQASAQPAHKSAVPAAAVVPDTNGGITPQPAVKMPAADPTTPVATPSPIAAQPAAPQLPLPLSTAALTMMQQVENQIEAAVQQGRRSLRMQLNPKELGAIEVHLVTTGATMSVTLTADKATTGSLLQKQLEDLRANLANAGVHQVTVNVGHQATSGQQGSNFNGGSNPRHYSQGGKDKDTSQNEAMPDPQLPQPGQEARIDYHI